MIHITFFGKKIKLTVAQVKKILERKNIEFIHVPKKGKQVFIRISFYGKNANAVSLGEIHWGVDKKEDIYFHHLVDLFWKFEKLKQSKKGKR